MGGGIAGAAGTGAAGEEGGHTEPEVNNNYYYYSYYYSTVGARSRELKGAVDQRGGGPLTPPQEPLPFPQRGRYRSKAPE